MRNKKPLSRSAQVIAFLRSQALVDEQAVIGEKTSSPVSRKSKAKSAATKKRKTIKKKVAFQSHRVGFHIGVTRLLVAALVGSLVVPVGSLAVPQLMNQAHAGPITTSGLLLNLDANDANSYGGSGNEWRDLSGNGYHATLLSPGNGYTLTYDSTNKAMSFSNQSRSSNDSNGAYATITSKEIPQQTWGGFSATFYANLGSGSANSWSRVLDFSTSSFTQGSGDRGGILIARRESGTNLQLGFRSMDGRTVGECIATNIITDNAFHHYAVTVDGNGTCIWYKNKNPHTGYTSTGGGTNASATSGSTGTNLKLPSNNAKSSLWIGRSHWNDRYLNGSIRNLAVYNTALTSAQVTANFDGQTGAYTNLGTTLTTPSAPTVSATSNTLKSISVAWSAITNASSYDLKLYNSGGTLLTTTGLTGRTGTSATITTSNFASLADSTAYKVSITAIGNGTSFLNSAESNRSDVTTNAPPGSPTITVQPTARTSTFNSTANFTVTATSPDSGTLGYQWQVSTDSGSNWSNVSTGTGATTNSYTTATLAMAANGYRYRVNVTNAKNGATSAAVTSSAVALTVNKAEQAAISLPVLSATTKSFPYSQTSLTVNSITGGTDTGALSITSVTNGSATGCSYTGTTLSASTSGTCTLTVTKAATTNYNAATTTATFTFTKANQSELIITANNFMRGETINVSTSGGNTTASIEYLISSGPCSISGTTVSNSGTGTCVLVATRPGNANYELVTATKSITVLPSNRAGLGTLVITPGTTVFTAATSTYAVSVSSTVNTISFTPTFTSTFASATFSGAPLTNGTLKTYTPTAGANTPFNIVVTAEDGVTTRTYIIRVIKVVTTQSSTSSVPNPGSTPIKKTTQPLNVPTVSLAPRIAGLSNSTGAIGSSVTITGTNLSTTLSVRLSGKSANILSKSDTQLVVTVPSGANSGPFLLTNPRGSATSARFTVTP